jgi:hypothetical protein
VYSEYSFFIKIFAPSFIVILPGRLDAKHSEYSYSSTGYTTVLLS